MGNQGGSAASKPVINAYIEEHKIPKPERERWLPMLSLRKEIGDAEYVPIETYASEQTDEELVLALTRRGFLDVDEIGVYSSAYFVVAFAFKDADVFYTGGRGLTPNPIGSGGAWGMLKISAHSANRFQGRLYASRYLLEVKAWNDIRLSRMNKER